MKNLLTILAFISFIFSASAFDCTTAIADAEFEKAISKIKTHDFDEAKKEAAEKLLTGNCFTSAQVKILLENLSFEEHKLELAKVAFSHVTDKENFGIIASIFEFDDAKTELMEFIKKN